MKNLLKIVGFLAGLVILIGLLGIPFGAGYCYENGYAAHRDARLAGLAAEEPGQIDVLCVGNSLGICGVDPMELYKNYGYTAYNAGCEMQMPVETYFTIKEALKTQKIKVILWEANNLSKHHKNLDAYISRLAEGLRYQFPFLRYHYAWKSVINGFIPRTYFKGYAVNEVIKPYTKGPYYDYSDEHTDVFAAEQYYYFDQIIKMCEENGITLVLYGVPSPVSYNIRMHKGLAKMAQESGVAFLDGNAVLEEIPIDWDRDTFDEGDHLNYYGTKKLTNYLAKYLSAQCALEDHRGDPVYQSWSDLLADYEQEIIDMEGTSYPLIEKQRKEESRPADYGPEFGTKG